MALIGPVIVGLALATAAGASAQPRDKAWLQQFMLTAEIVDAVPIGRGVTKPWRLTLSSGEITDDVAFNSVNKQRTRGFWESYKAEIAAYELDKLLGLGMVPVTVERRIRGDLGAAVMWVAPQESFKELGGTPTPPRVSLATGPFS